MVVTVEGVGDVEVAPGTPLDAILAAVRAPAAVWCGGVRLDGAHRAGRPPLVAGALLAPGPGPAPSPPAGPHLRVVAGPDAGATLVAHDGALVVGRDGAAPLADPALSRRHLVLGADGRVRDLGSRNGTVRERDGRSRRLGRVPRRLRPGDLVRAGGSVLRWVDPTATDDATAGTAAPARPATMLAGLAGAAAGAVALGAATGRWVIAVAMVGAPVAVAVAALARRRRGPAGVAPVGIEALAALPLPIAVEGTPERARAVVRAIVLARGAAAPPPLHEGWMRWLEDRLHDGDVRIVPPGVDAPSEAATVLDAGRGLMRRDGRTVPWELAAVAERTADVLARARASQQPADLPTVLRWADLPPPPHRADPDGGRAAGRRLVARLGVDADGPVDLDLDGDGPHVLVAGTTGAGKSALLETLVSALAHAHGPDRLGIALVDLKAGAGLGGCAALPHVRGLLTDLERASARRALLGLACELRERKRALSSAGVASWREWEDRPGAAAPARLLVVVDEFQELAALDPGFLPELARLAAQGRALGMHLVLATQRPAGAVSPAIRANVATVIALRAASASESQDLLGDAEAAALPAAVPGRAIVDSPHGRTTMQAALPLADPRPPVRPLGEPVPPSRPLAAAAAARWASAEAAAPLWLAPDPPDGPAPAGALGWLDLPEQRSRRPLAWDPRAGPLVVVGPRGSGRSGVLDAAAAAMPGAARLPADPREAARTLALAAAARPTALLIDDADIACTTLEPLLRGAAQALEDLARLVPLVLACGPGWGTRWASRSGLTVALGGLDRVEAALWGVPPALVGRPPEPGRGVAVTAAGAGECWIPRARAGPGRVLVRPLRCPADLAAGAIGVVGDEARALMLPRGGLRVVGPPGRARDHAVRVLAEAGAEPEAATRVAPGAGLVVVVEPTPMHVRELGIAATPGLADPSPPPGRVLVGRDGVYEAAQLRSVA
ncbi:FtsK/SpoIIIE domain-containing protein [Demequina sp. SYSU T00192]|uniref:FtsK/SpoIIIE domain-containing protein n=1 Tax=Demequina litoralis TaxID=3051660 RepID=A0ABT8G7M2_9MICO|nr:FtsK/SpoIIIE domain-containing protein [Demequina sp. SYSU T00192]MDN4474924.1 FtsK/SpoIIIE domain-containing protein [Demequina sp. SYSU T00192]